MKIEILLNPIDSNLTTGIIIKLLDELKSKLTYQSAPVEVGHTIDIMDIFTGLKIGQYSVQSSHNFEDESLMTASQLAKKYGRHEHKEYTRDDWKEIVAEGSTILSYWDWVVSCLEPDD